MTTTPPPGWHLDSAREQEIRDQYAELGASTSLGAVGPYSALGDLLVEITRLRAELDERTADIADRVLENASLRAELSDRTAEARQLRTVATRADSLIDTEHTDEAATLLRHHAAAGGAQ